MRINGEIIPQEEEEKGEVKTVPLSIQQPRKLVVVGYALTSKKKKSFLQPKLEVLAGNKGILFVAIDLNRPLSDQGPFDVILHKLSGKGWCEVIEDYQQKHLEAIVLDPPDAIQHLHNRQSMLQDVADLDLSDCQGKVCVPRQMVVNKDPSSIPREVTKAGLKLPLGGVLFKIYVVGEAIKVVRRFSLPNISKCELAKVAGVFRFPRVSSAASSADDVDLDPSVGGLRLFNIDMIREHGTKDVFYVIDINSFLASYGKMPDYEHTFTDFLLGLVQSKYKKRPAK
ncbi:hypothetical protein GH714_009154 [Hevea brasiliensis]|uniref:Inositol-tetrakisphosphate 1-kinase n=1 Tax=Hevea brasiliensis TaxID=3981 RepID=A0A6A6KZ48_HEVBR|nr:hypothetical protein GH714_009154 [Hevea brasiliensis]